LRKEEDELKALLGEESSPHNSSDESN
jgi:hypothetical protein